jgi:hypothetical protein
MASKKRRPGKKCNGSFLQDMKLNAQEKRMDELILQLEGINRKLALRPPKHVNTRDLPPMPMLAPLEE